MYTEISRMSVQILVACLNASTSKRCFLRSWNVSRLSEARLQAVSSRNMYSEHGLLARISPCSGQVCQSFTVVWYCRPGSAEAQAAWPIFSHRSRAFTDFLTLPVLRQVRSQLP